MSRKEFLKKSWAGLLSFGVWRGLIQEPLKLGEKHMLPNASYRSLGRTGIKVTAMGLGATRTMEPSVVKMSIDAGLNFIDTGRHYFNGQNETMIGKVIKGIRQGLVLQTKIRLQIRERGKQLESTEVMKKIVSQMQKSLEESLKALQTDYIDSLLLHGVSDLEIIKLEEIRKFFLAAKQKGQIRAFGFSMHSEIQILEAFNEDLFYDVIMLPFNHKGSYVHALSGQYHEWDQAAVKRELQKASKNNLSVVAMKTCSAGPYSPSPDVKPSYTAALKWILNHSFISTMAVAMANRQEIEENMRALSL